MKKFLGIVIICFSINSNLYAKENWSSKDTLSMHEYLNSGWKIHSTHSVEGQDLYHVFILQKENKIIYCRIVNSLKETCFQPRRKK